MVTEEELRTRFTWAMKTLKAERAMRERLFRADPIKRMAKTKEMDECMATLVWMKNALKEAGLVAPEPEQARLLPDERTHYP